MEKEFRSFLKEYYGKTPPLYKEASLAYFDATISGKAEDYEKASKLQIDLSNIYSDREDFALLKKVAEHGEFSDPVLNRELTTIYNDYASNQFDEELLKQIIELSTKVEEKFATFRVEYNGNKITDNEIDDILKDSTDQKELEGVWKASKAVGRQVEEDVRNLVGMRNRAAKEMGFNNYYQMSLKLSEQEPEEIDDLFRRLDELTREAFAKLKGEIDNVLAGKFGIEVKDLKPWHYEDKFFQQGPMIYETDLDKFYKNEDLVKVTKDYFGAIGMDISDLLDKSDLFEKEGKYQHAYCTDIDREGDIRVLCNIKPNYRWMGTMLHEYGHAVYDKYVDKELPWQLRSHAHIFTTEAIAMLFGRLAANPEWMTENVGLESKEADLVTSDCYNSLRLEQLVFTRWVQVMYNFEKEMYNNPDQDLNQLWWDLVEKYQMIKKPEGRNEPDWAAKIHVALYPAYYHNYMLGELLASQLYYYIKDNILREKNNQQFISFSGNKNIGHYLINEFFSHGARYHWSELIEKATGEKLDPGFYARQFVND